MKSIKRIQGLNEQWSRKPQGFFKAWDSIILYINKSYDKKYQVTYEKQKHTRTKIKSYKTISLHSSYGRVQLNYLKIRIRSGWGLYTHLFKKWLEDETKPHSLIMNIKQVWTQNCGSVVKIDQYNVSVTRTKLNKFIKESSMSPHKFCAQGLLLHSTFFFVCTCVCMRVYVCMCTFLLKEHICFDCGALSRH